MNESLKPRFSVDLDEIERQLAQSRRGSTPEARYPGASRTEGRTDARNDPLAELARIVGQDDPFQTVLAAERSPRPAGRHAAPENLFDPRGGAPADPRGPFAPPAPAQDPAAYADTAEFEPYDPHYDETAYEEREPDLPPQDQMEEAPRRAQRKGFVAVGAVLGCAVLGLGGAFALKGDGQILGSGGEPPLIQATNEPVKVAPQAPGGVEIPNQNKQIYERSQDGQTKTVSREEQPVDVRQAARSAGPETTGSAVSTGGLNLGEPRKVRTVSIRPDGTIIGQDGTARPPSQQQTASLQLPPAASAGALAPAAATPPSAPRAAAAATPSSAAPVAKTSAATPAGAGDGSPQSAASGATPAAKPPAAARERIAAVSPPAAPAPAAAAAATGGFAVQVGVSRSEAEAEATLQRMQTKYADLGGLTPLIRKAEVNGNTVYRVRVGPMARDEASSLCSKIQGQGGQCFVAKN